MQTKESRDKLRQRKGIAESVFGRIKHQLGYKSVSLRGFEGVRAEISLAVLAYNLKRAINILESGRLISCTTSQRKRIREIKENINGGCCE